MRDHHDPRWARVLSRLLPSRHRAEVLGDLIEERSAMIRRGRSRVAAACWLLAHLLRSAVAGRRGAEDARPAGDSIVRSVLQDGRHALRLLRRRPGFTAVAVMTLGLGIGANVAVFSVSRALLFPSLPFPDPAQVVRVFQSRLDRPDDGNGSTTSPGLFMAWHTRGPDVLQSVAAYRSNRVTLSGDGIAAARLAVIEATPDIFDVMRVPPVQGRVLTASDAALDQHVTVVSEELWRTSLGADPDIIGRSIRLDDEPWTVVGVMPGNLAFSSYGRADLWRPLVLPPNLWQNTSASFLDVIGRLRPGVSPTQAGARLAAITATILDRGGTPSKITANAVGYLDALVGDLRGRLLLLQGITAAVLLVACVNIANLLLAAATARRREMSLRSSLGASRMRLARQLLTEGLVLSLAGSLVGLVLSAWAGPALVAAYPARILQYQPVAFGIADLGAALVVAVVVTCLFSLAPVVAGSRGGVAHALKGVTHTDGSRTLRLARSGLVGAEVAVALVLIVGGGLLVRSFWRLTNQPLGFDPAHVVVATIAVPSARYADAPARREFFSMLLDRLGTSLDVTSVAAATRLPFDLSGAGGARQVDLGHGEITQVLSSTRTIDGDLFATLGIPIVRGRAMTAADDASREPVAVVSEAFARATVPSGDVVGLRLRAGSRGAWTTIVGVAADVRTYYAAPPGAELYLPLRQADAGEITLVVRTSGAPAAMLPRIEALVHEIDPALPVDRARTYEEMVRASVGTNRFNMLALGLLASLATLLAAIGIAGVMSYVVGLRTREIGIRLALGARTGQVQRLIVRQGLRPVVAGLAAGLAGSWWLTATLRSALFDVTPHDAVTLVAAPALFLAVALAACWWPAMRAGQVNPTVTLRGE